MRSHYLGKLRLLLVLMAVCGVLGGAAYAAGNERPTWLSAAEPEITRLTDLPSNQEPLSTSIDCEMRFQPDGITACAYSTPLGVMTSDWLFDGPKGTHRYSLSSPSILPSVPGKKEMLITQYQPRNWSLGEVMEVGSYEPDKLLYDPPNGIKDYQYKGARTKTLTHKAGSIEENIAFYENGQAYSTNGNWLVSLVAGGGLMVYDTTDFQGKLITWGLNTFRAGTTQGDTVAVSDSGRYVAVTLNIGPTGTVKPALRVYDVKSCIDQHDNRYKSDVHPCEYKDFWMGEYRTGKTRSVKDVLPSAEYPRRVRFTANDTLMFDTVYGRTSPTTYQVARYQIKLSATTTREYVGVLGMGDSYISGEGAAGTYYTGTDTKQNKCHLSWLSYPYRIGGVHFPYGRSVACSGAKMFDVSMAAGDPKGGVKSEDGYKGQVKQKPAVSWKDRDTEKIIESFSPGYAQQNIFAAEYKPRTILLSIGGNDIHFADIVKACVDPRTSPSTCYPYYEDRLQIMKQILGQYDRLVKTYKSVINESKGRVYVIGYPQILKVDGSCGMNVQLDSTEVKLGSYLIKYLNGIIKNAANEAGAYYVNTEDALKNYRLCEAPKGQAAMNGATKGNDDGPLKMIGNESFHPTAFGHKLLAQFILAQTSNLTAVRIYPPVPNNKPALDLNNALLQVPHAPKQDAHSENLIWQDTDITPLLTKNKKYTTTMPKGSLQDGTNMRGVLHSDPAELFSGEYNEDAPLSFTVPESIEPGFHRLDVYGTDVDGRPVDLRQNVYVAASEEDYDGDSTPNAADSCPAMPGVGDEDNDGIDDACDGVIGPQAVEDVPVLTPNGPLDLDTPGGEADAYEGSLVTPYIAPSEPPAEQGNDLGSDTGVTGGQGESGAAAHDEPNGESIKPSTATAEPLLATPKVSVINLVTVNSVPKNAPVLGSVLAAGSENVMTSNAAAVAPQMLGGATKKSSKGSKITNPEHKIDYLGIGLVAAGVLGLLVIFKTIFRRETN